jgi:hypothetical protein
MAWRGRVTRGKGMRDGARRQSPCRGHERRLSHGSDGFNDKPILCARQHRDDDEGAMPTAPCQLCVPSKKNDGTQRSY